VGATGVWFPLGTMNKVVDGASANDNVSHPNLLIRRLRGRPERSPAIPSCCILPAQMA
jgi:hypothetical protein